MYTISEYRTATPVPFPVQAKTLSFPTPLSEINVLPPGQNSRWILKDRVVILTLIHWLGSPIFTGGDPKRRKQLGGFLKVRQ